MPLRTEVDHSSCHIVLDGDPAGPISLCLDSFFSERELTFAICCRPSVCLSFVCLSVTLVHPTQAVQIFGNISTAFATLAIR